MICIRELPAALPGMWLPSSTVLQLARALCRTGSGCQTVISLIKSQPKKWLHETQGRVNGCRTRSDSQGKCFWVKPFMDRLAWKSKFATCVGNTEQWRVAAVKNVLSSKANLQSGFFLIQEAALERKRCNGMYYVCCWRRNKIFRLTKKTQKSSKITSAYLSSRQDSKRKMLVKSLQCANIIVDWCSKNWLHLRANCQDIIF